eukprot:CAMPEP_0168842076 /NCGR_PEP_ID=MMETSP0727-20121128/7504_1 /TAXON_ID=265536 /ORGANISM="Amphiprora sp., Strain CCMP467" /LENGTH=353 /DNA_ID=CAMNT_0008895615 /DNA_START=61 /DNA_END=1120 /DNA_ORIENTATION=-
MAAATTTTTTEYRTALALNNIGVALMQRGDATAALETLRDAKLLLNHCYYCPGNANHHALCGGMVASPQVALQSATLRYTKTSIQPPQQSSWLCDSHHEQEQFPHELYPQQDQQHHYHHHQADIHVLEDEDFAAIRDAAKCGLSGHPYTVFPMRISSFDPDDMQMANTNNNSNDDDDNNNNATVVMMMKHHVTIFYNLGLAHVLAAAQQHQPQMLKRSLETLQMNEVLIQDALEDSTVDLDEDQELYLLLLSALVLNSASSVYRRLDLPFQSQEAHRLGAIICSEVDDDGCFAGILAKPRLAAAARERKNNTGGVDTTTTTASRKDGSNCHKDKDSSSWIAATAKTASRTTHT